MTDLLIVRHGQSEWNAAGKWQGRADPPLTDLGRKQAADASAQLPAFDLLAASPQVRARVTAEVFARELGCTQPLINDGLMERDAGEFSGLTVHEIHRQFPGYLDEGRWPPGWEATTSVVLRVRAALDSIAQTAGPEATVVIVAHGGVIYALEEQFGIGHERIGNLGGRWFSLNNGEFGLGERIHLLDAAHETIPDQL